MHVTLALSFFVFLLKFRQNMIDFYLAKRYNIIGLWKQLLP